MRIHVCVSQLLSKYFYRTHLILFYAHCKSIMCKLWMSGCCLVVVFFKTKTASHTFTWHLVSTDTCITPLDLDHFIQYVFKIRKRWSFLVLYTSNKRFLFLYFILKTMAIYFSLKILLRKWTFLLSFFSTNKTLIHQSSVSVKCRIYVRWCTCNCKSMNKNLLC